VNTQFGERGGVGTIGPFNVSSVPKPSPPHTSAVIMQFLRAGTA
jgi:hypothetical protein